MRMGLSPVERAIVADLLENGDNVPGNIAENTGYHPKSVQRSISNLVDMGVVRSKGRGVYTVSPDKSDLVESVLDYQQKTGAID